MVVIWTHQSHLLNGLIWRSFLNPRPDRNNTGSPTRRRAQMVQARQLLENTRVTHNRDMKFYKPSSNTIVLQTEFKYTIAYILYKFYNRCNQSSIRKDLHYTNYSSSDSAQPVRPVLSTGQTGYSRPVQDHRSDRSKQNRGAAHSAVKCATRRLPSLLVPVHHFPPLCVTADELDTIGAEVNVRVPWNKFGGNKPWATNTQQDLPDQWVYLAHISRHAKLLGQWLVLQKKASKSKSLLFKF
jgi:hypothetical protein